MVIDTIKYFKGLFGEKYTDNLLYKIYTEDTMNFNVGVLEELRTEYMFKDIDFYIYDREEIVGYLREDDNHSYSLYDTNNNHILNIDMNSLNTIGITTYIAEMKPMLPKLMDKKDEDISLEVKEDIGSDDFPPFISERAIDYAIRHSQVYTGESKSRTYNRLVNSPATSKIMDAVTYATMAGYAMLGVGDGLAITNLTPIKHTKSKHWKETQDILDKNRAIEKAALKREIKQMKKSGKVDKETLGIMQKQYREM